MTPRGDPATSGVPNLRMLITSRTSDRLSYNLNMGYSGIGYGVRS
jgi:hypothetical protein